MSTAEADRAATPDYMPARMLNEFVYCPRLFYYEWVEGVFVESSDTVEGRLRHEKVERKEDSLPTAEDAEASGDQIHSRSVTLSSEEHKLIAKMDLIEGEADASGQLLVTPVDYKRGAPREKRTTKKGSGVDCRDGPKGAAHNRRPTPCSSDDDGGLEAWEPDRVQLAVQAIILRENGYRCDEGVIYYVATKQRVRVAIDEELVRQTLDTLERARATAAGERIPSPLLDSPKCPRCSLVGVCLPDETQMLVQITRGVEPCRQMVLFDGVEERPTEKRTRDLATIELPAVEVRRLVPARDDLRPLYLNSQGLRFGKSGEVLQIHEKDKLLQEVRLGEISQLNLFGNIQLTTQAIQSLCAGEIPIAYFSMGGWFYGVTHGLGVKNIFLRREQFRMAERASFCLELARSLVAGKIRNQRTMIQRNHIEPPSAALVQLKCAIDDAGRAESLDVLLGIEGNAARVYFESFAGMIKVQEDSGVGVQGSEQKELSFDFVHRNRRPPRDAVNALLSLAYSMLAKDLTIVCHAVGFDPYLGFYHQPRFGRPALALDLMEPFRPLIADSAVIGAINTRMVTPRDFLQVGPTVALKPDARRAFYRAYEQRMDTLVTHPLFGYRVNYRRVLEIQARLLARLLTGELQNYPVFVTR